MKLDGSAGRPFVAFDLDLTVVKVITLEILENFTTTALYCSEGDLGPI